jgi:hypothetical protein
MQKLEEQRMKSNINKIFRRNIYLLELIDKIVYYFRVQNYDTALRIISIALDHLSIILQNLSEETEYFLEKENEINLNLLTGLVEGLMKAQISKDYVLLADLYELQMVPYLYHLQAFIIANEQELFDPEVYKFNFSVLKNSDEELLNTLMQHEKTLDELQHEYHVEYTSCGLKTLSFDMGNTVMYMHSNRNAISEAFALAHSWYEEDKTEYIVYGLGLGYHIKELGEIDTSIIIHVFESDIHMIQMACVSTDLYLILHNSNIHIHYDPDFTKLTNRLKQMNDETAFVIHYPSLCRIQNLIFKDKLESYFIQYNSSKNQARFMNSNFNDNINNYDNLIDILKDKFVHKDLYIVAAGPSLDKNYEQLKEVGGKGIILATGTVFKKIIKQGIVPDYVIVTDANPRVYSQIKGVENYEIPMLLLSTACRNFAKKYQGKKYIICQKDYKKAEEFASQAGAMLFNTGGSVSTTALDIGITFACKRIIFLGLDLAYTNNYVHATDTSQRDLANTEDLRQVEDIHGDLIFTSKSLDMYRKWIENRIRGVEGIEFIDATEGGAKIEGMKIRKLSECISSNENMNTGQNPKSY